MLEDTAYINFIVRMTPLKVRAHVLIMQTTSFSGSLKKPVSTVISNSITKENTAIKRHFD